MKHTIMCKCGKLAIKCDEASEAIEGLIQRRIKEVLDDIENSTVEVPLFHKDCDCEWCMIKKKHLNTSDTENKKEGK